ncbi:MAG TPA: hypothetical protein VMR23_09525 [Candidatus Limnocylindria bacterium]|nr:hypothetical protein [Candidatus Limnocylindria bacterium]
MPVWVCGRLDELVEPATPHRLGRSRGIQDEIDIRWWREGRYGAIVIMSGGMRAELVDSDVRLASWLTAAFAAQEEGRSLPH